MFVHEWDWFQNIAEMLAHLATVFVQDVAEAQHVLVRRLVKDQGANCHQGVEPTTGLVNGLTDEVSRVASLEKFDIGFWITLLREWHGTGIKPAVNDFRNAVSGLATFPTGKCDIVNVRAMWVHCERVIACEFS
jgi:hypothetical protein